MGLRASVLATVATVAALVAACAAAPPASGRTAEGRELASPIGGVAGVANLARVDSGLYRGAQPDAEGYRNLKELGIRTVISLRSWHSARSEAEAAGLRYVEIPLQADVLGSSPPSDEQLREFFATALDPESRPVFVHCAHGKDRTGTMCALYRIEVDGWSPEEAIEEMQAFGYHDVYRDLIRFVRDYRAGAPPIRDPRTIPGPSRAHEASPVRRSGRASRGQEHACPPRTS